MTSKLRLADVLAVGSVGLRTRRLRAGLSALGIAIGIASMVAVLGVSASSQADLLATIDRLGTNLLTVEPGQALLGGDQPVLPITAPPRLQAVDGVEDAAATYAVPGVTVRRNHLIDEADDSGIVVLAADATLPEALGAHPLSGHWLSDAEREYPAVVLGRVAAKRLGISTAGALVHLGERWFTVVGILDTVALDPMLDRAALIGLPAAITSFASPASSALGEPSRWA